MSNYELQSNEVILFEGPSSSKEYKGTILLTLTSQKLILEKEKGLFKKEKELLDIIPFENIKFYNSVAQIKQKNNIVDIQTTEKNISLSFSGMLEARKFVTKIMDAVTGTTLAQRSSDKIIGAFNIVDETLGLDTRSTVKGILEHGVKGTILNGIGKKNK